MVGEFGLKANLEQAVPFALLYPWLNLKNGRALIHPMTKHILIIDDEADIREATQVCLEVAKEWTVLTAGSSHEGLEIAASKQPDAILLDVMMPDMDGLATIEMLRDNPFTQNIPVILLTAKAQPADLRRFNQLEVAAVITKPYDPLVLADQIAEILS